MRAKLSIVAKGARLNFELSLMNTELVAKEYQILKEVDSTNTALKELAAQQNLPEGFCLLTDYQRLGRGQYGKQWESKAGQNLLFSLYLEPNFLPAAESYRLTMSVCLALQDLAEHYQLPTQIKWPNDWYLGYKKLAGVLAESSLRGSRIESCIMGIGLNVKQKEFPYPNASSLEMALGKDLQPWDVFQSLATFLDHRYLELKSGGGLLQQREFENHLYGKDCCVKVRRKGEQRQVRCLGVEANGSLKVEWENGRRETIRHQELQFLMPNQ